ncbi:MAG: hypothetical protein ITG00_03380, partial [Flavobacterium sp.]|nr:hypothetical protein [Flavobacterium sp.]
MAKKIYTQEELQARANDALKQFPTVNKVYATVDGNVFVDKNRAELHAGPKGRVLPFERTIEVAPREYDLNAKDTIAAIKATAKIEDLEAFKSDERKSV